MEQRRLAEQYVRVEQRAKVYERHSSQVNTIKSGVAVPLLQSVVSGVLMAVLAGAGLSWLKMPLTWEPVLTIGILVACVVWLAGLRQWKSLAGDYDRVIEPLEPALPGIEPLPAVEPVEQRLRLELVEPGGEAAQYIRFPVDASRLITLARALHSGKPFTEASFCAGSRGLFSRQEFVKLRDELLARKLITLNSPSTPARGYKLTSGGRAAIKYLANLELTDDED